MVQNTKDSKETTIETDTANFTTKMAVSTMDNGKITIWKAMVPCITPRAK